MNKPQQETTTQTEGDNFELELKAMGDIGKALQPLTSQAQQRVLQWAMSRYLSGTNPSKIIPPNFINPANETQKLEDGIDDLPTFFDRASVHTNIDKALVVGYWIQERQNNADFGSQEINTELKHLGHGVGNITEAFNSLITQKFVMQIRKSGTSKQARKKYKLTREGIKRVQQMLQQVTE